MIYSPVADSCLVSDGDTIWPRQVGPRAFSNILEVPKAWDKKSKNTLKISTLGQAAVYARGSSVGEYACQGIVKKKSSSIR